MKQTSNTISTKDLSYFCDMFNWNLNSYQLFSHFENQIKNEETKKVIMEIKEMHNESMIEILTFFNGSEGGNA